MAEDTSSECKMLEAESDTAKQTLVVTQELNSPQTVGEGPESETYRNTETPSVACELHRPKTVGEGPESETLLHTKEVVTQGPDSVSTLGDQPILLPVEETDKRDSAVNITESDSKTDIKDGNVGLVDCTKTDASQSAISGHKDEAATSPGIMEGRVDVPVSGGADCHTSEIVEPGVVEMAQPAELGSNVDTCVEEDDTLPESDQHRTRHTSIRSLSESSSGSECEYRMARLCESATDLGMSQLDSDTGSSAVSLRNKVSSETSSSDSPLAELESLRQGAASVISNVSSYSWMREDTMGSAISIDPTSALGRFRADMAREAAGSGDNQGVTAELSEKLVEGPTVTLYAPKSSKDVEMETSEKLLPQMEPPVVPTPQSRLDSNNSSKEGETLHKSDAQKESSVTAVPPTDPSTSLSAPVSVNEMTVVPPPASSPQTVAESSSKQTVQVETAAESTASQTLTSQADVALSTPGASVSPSTQSVSVPASTSQSESAATTSEAAAAAKPRIKKTPNDFIFGKVIGEGSYSTVYLAKEVSSQKEFAIKVCEKKHLIRERKTHFVMREKEVFMKLEHPFFVKLAYTFQDSERLYYVLTYARNGELLGYLHKLSSFDVPCTRFYTAEIVLALEYLHNLGIIHRDLKPENILLSGDMHIKITDFGTSKILQLDQDGKPIVTETKRKNSFVGTAEYVSPEVLNNQPANYGSDLWALGCIIYQCLSGSMPFRSGNEYQTFQKIVKAEFTFPEGFNDDAKDLVSKLLVLEPDHRLGMPATGGMPALKAHNFFSGVDWTNLPTSTPPKLMPYLPATSHNPEFWGQDHRVGFHFSLE